MSDVRALGSTIARYRFQDGFPDLSDMEPVICPTHPWLAEIAHPLPVDAPLTADPLCCYLDTVIFYETPYRRAEGGWAEHDRCDTPIRLDDILAFDDGAWRVMSGKVAAGDGRWHMLWVLRKLEDEEAARWLS